MSKQLVLFSFAEIREYNQSVYKRTYFSDKSDLLHNGYMDWIVQRMKELGMKGWIFKDHDFPV